MSERRHGFRRSNAVVFCQIALAVIVGSFLILQTPEVAKASVGPPTRGCSSTNEGDTEDYDPYPTMFHWECVCRWSAGGTKKSCKWEIVPGPNPGSKMSSAYVYGTSTYGCVFLKSGIGSDYYGAASNVGLANVYSLNWVAGDGCAGTNKYQPAGELRARARIQYYTGSSWATCQTSSYGYNSASAYTISWSFNMGGVPDCGSATYRVVSDGHMYDGGAWRGGSVTSGSYWMQ